MSDLTESEHDLNPHQINISLEQAGTSTVNQANYAPIGKNDYSPNIMGSDPYQEPHTRWQPELDKTRCPPSSYHDFRGIDTHDQMDRLLNNQVSKPILFDLQNSWLKGEQYAHILQNQDRYC